MPAIFAMIGGWRGVAIGAAALLAVLYVGWMKLAIAGLERETARLSADLTVARANLETATAVNDHNRGELERLAADWRAADSATAQALAAAERRCTASLKIRKDVAREIERNPSTCPVAGSVRAALDGLRASARSPAGDEDRTRAGDAAGGAADVPR